MALCTVAAPAVAAPSRLPPIDECKGDREFAAFRANLKDAIQREDAKALLALMAPDVLVDFGGGTGPAAFAKSWGLDGGPSELWPTIKPILRMGCAKSGDAFVLPSLSVQWDSDDDLEERWLVVGPSAKLRQGPAYDSPVIAKLAWDVVTITNNESDVQSGIRLADGRQGWIADADLYSPMGLRMVVEKRGAKWLITAFVAGD